ncbi:hypothetical protein P153DRAFT_311713 [Dothidotthia symphoricarpi CBS 119687]|uniref:Protein-arginine deiminase C-terminal domain-containing protein n=1 Tax=Dothidotthia symphoricarpi CBS 119687 TaxID=1392245 RepID=A0A6A6AJW2_9PLEO|nr:uncharacterized protein P153DRAFT_311713 [Dothidotthia symphoricarpi CBS 119687]KAF2131385.1 hypothetical protein P153DRAFT_311713 [Dothidotthia symphoricarpi CBS 119687]
MIKPLLVALALQAGSIAAQFIADIRADTNRDGRVDLNGTSDSAGKSFWTATRGAIFLPNVGDKHMRCAIADRVGNPLSNDELAYCNDASGHLLLAPEYLAPLYTVPLQDISDNATAQVYVTPRAAYERTRIFALEDTAKPNATESWRLVDRQLYFNATQLRAGLVLGIDGREFVKDTNVWNGHVTVHFDVTDAISYSSAPKVATDVVAMKVAPVLTHHPLQRVETLVATGANETDLVQLDFVSQIEAARRAVGLENPLLLFNQSSDIWAQDILEPAYVSMPGPNGPIALRVMLRSAQSTRTGGRQIFEQLRGPGVGAFQPGSATGTGFGYDTINSYGNLETIPPHRSKHGVNYPAGRTIFGKHWEQLPSQPVRDLLYGNEVQTPLVLETGWLLVGHVDEIVQFLPYDNELGWTIAIADTRIALDVLHGVHSTGNGNVTVLSFNTSRAEALNAQPPSQAGLTMSVNEILANSTFTENQAYAQRHLDANLDILLAEIPLNRSDVIFLPALFEDQSAGPQFVRPDGLHVYWWPVKEGERQLGAFLPAAVNGIIIGHEYLCPEPWGPMVNGQDVFRPLVEAAYARANMNVTYIDDWLSHHSNGGEIHCGTNTLRQTDIPWWG